MGEGQDVERWQADAPCRVCGRRVAEGSAWRDDDGDLWNAHWDCHLRQEAARRARGETERRLRASMAGHLSWALTEDRIARTHKARWAWSTSFSARLAATRCARSPFATRTTSGWR